MTGHQPSLTPWFAPIALFAEGASAAAPPAGAAEDWLKTLAWLVAILLGVLYLLKEVRAFRKEAKKEDDGLASKADLDAVEKKLEQAATRADLENYVRRTDLAQAVATKVDLGEAAVGLKERIGVISDRQRELDEYTHRAIHKINDALHTVHVRLEVMVVEGRAAGDRAERILAQMDDHTRKLERLTAMVEVIGRAPHPAPRGEDNG